MSTKTIRIATAWTEEEIAELDRAVKVRSQRETGRRYTRSDLIREGAMDLAKRESERVRGGGT